jgi:hypothetical protein
VSGLVVCWTNFDWFIVRGREPWAKKYELLGETRSQRKAYRMLADAMLSGKYDKGDVLGTTREPSYYEPHQLVEMVK